MVAYATEADVYLYGLPRGALGNPGRVVESALAATSTITLSEHGFALGTPVTFRITQGGVMAAPLVAGTVYYALPVTDSSFQVSATPSGPPISLTLDGVQMIAAADLPWAALLEFYSRWLDGFLPAEAVPLTPAADGTYPVTVRGIVAQLAAKRAQILSGATSESMDAVEAAAAKQAERWAAGLPVRDLATRKPSNLAVVNQRRHEHRLGRPFFDPFFDGICRREDSE